MHLLLSHWWSASYNGLGKSRHRDKICGEGVCLTWIFTSTHWFCVCIRYIFVCIVTWCCIPYVRRHGGVHISVWRIKFWLLQESGVCCSFVLKLYIDMYVRTFVPLMGEVVCWKFSQFQSCLLYIWICTAKSRNHRLSKRDHSLDNLRTCSAHELGC